MRFITLALGGEAYLCFMGNEFGHPEWIDFPREGNGWSYHYARRRWDLVDNQLLRFSQWNKFDEEMIQLETKYKWLTRKDNYISLKHEVIFSL
jgi:1,4-alpha-glucan branching enzyme